MDTMAVEQYAVDAVRDCINYSDHLSPFVSDNDKEPSWDGHVYIYGSKKSKEHLKGRIPVQVKGTEQTDLTRAEITFRMSMADLRNYLHDGGCLLLVVYIKQDKEAMKTQSQIYYRELTPVRLKEMLAGVKENAQSMLVSLVKMPETISAIDDMVLNCLNNCKKQASFADTPLPTYEELNKAGLIERLSIPFSRFGMNTRPEEAYLSSDSYVYAKVRGMEALQPLAGLMDKKFISHDENIPISVNGVVYYDGCNILEAVDKTVYRIGKGLTITGQKDSQGVSVKYTAPKMLRDYVRDQRFMIAAVNNGGWEIGRLRMDITPNNSDLSQYDIDEQTQRFEFYSKVVRLFEIIGCEEDIDITTFTDEHVLRLYRLITGIVDKEVVEGLRNDLPPLMYMEVGSLRFMIGFSKTDKEGAYILKDFRDVDVCAIVKTNDGQEIPLPKYSLLKKEDLMTVSNIPFDKILNSFKTFSASDHVYNAANALLLELIAAFDSAKGRRKERLLNTATEIADWLCDLPETAWDARISRLNKLQLIKRVRELNDDERNTLYDITEGWPRQLDVLTGAYLLLGEKGRAQRFYSQMTPEEQKAFASYPIYHFWQ